VADAALDSGGYWLDQERAAEPRVLAADRFGRGGRLGVHLDPAGLAAAVPRLATLLEMALSAPMVDRPAPRVRHPVPVRLGTV
jgi:hypothetical protein